MVLPVPPHQPREGVGEVTVSKESSAPPSLSKAYERGETEMGLHETLSVLPDLHTVDDHLTPDTRAVWVFTPDAGADWLVWEYDPVTGMAFGLCDMGHGFPEIGSVVMTQRDVGYEDDDIVDRLRAGQFGLPAEVDKTINTIAKGYRHKALEVPEGLFT